MPRYHNSGILQGIQALSNGLLNGIEIPTPEIGSPNAAAKERVAGQDHVIARKIKTHGAGGVAGGMECNRRDLANQQPLLILQPIVGQRDGDVYDAEHPALQF